MSVNGNPMNRHCKLGSRDRLLYANCQSDLQYTFQAETNVLDAMGVVVRTSLVYGLRPPDPRTNVLWKGLISGKFAYPYFKDEFRGPIHVADLCRALAEIGTNICEGLL